MSPKVIDASIFPYVSVFPLNIMLSFAIKDTLAFSIGLPFSSNTNNSIKPSPAEHSSAVIENSCGSVKCIETEGSPRILYT